MEVAFSLPADAVTRALDRAIAERGAQPEVITIDNGTEFTSRHFDNWAHTRGIRLDFIRPGKSVENGYVESFNGKYRDECLSQSWFLGLDDARATIARWRIEYNEARPFLTGQSSASRVSLDGAGSFATHNPRSSS